jgi:hypothetical protein
LPSTEKAEEIDGRVYVDIAQSAREAALLILYGIYPKRMSEESLARQVARHGYSQQNANMGVKRIPPRWTTMTTEILD